MKHLGFSLNFRAGGGFFKVDVSGSKVCISSRGICASLLSGKNLEMEMPVNAFWRNLMARQLCHEWEQLPKLYGVASEVCWLLNDFQSCRHFALHRWTDCESNQTVFSFFFLRAETPLGAQYKAINQICPTKYLPPGGDFDKLFCPWGGEFEFFWRKCQIPSTPLSALHVFDRVSPHNHSEYTTCLD